MQNKSVCHANALLPTLAIFQETFVENLVFQRPLPSLTRKSETIRRKTKVSE